MWRFDGVSNASISVQMLYECASSLLWSRSRKLCCCWTSAMDYKSASVSRILSNRICLSKVWPKSLGGEKEVKSAPRFHFHRHLHRAALTLPPRE
jgi:hypothetical protein